jgi:hypothetical protein
MTAFKLPREDRDYNAFEPASVKLGGGSQFLDTIRTEHRALYKDYAERGGDHFSDLETMLHYLEIDAWSIVERALKESYKNGLARNSKQQKRKVKG